MQFQWAIALPIFLGFCVVLQGTMNRHLSSAWGLSGAALLTNIIVVILNLLLFLSTRKHPGFYPEFFHDRGSFSAFKWWYFLPGLCGFSIVVGGPWAISRLGAFQFVIFLVTAQMVASLAWDASIENIPLSFIRVSGAALALIGAILVTWK